MRDDLIRLVTTHNSASELEQQHKVNTLEFLADNEQCTSVSTLEGHITASAWLLSKDFTRVLLTHHRKLSRWFQLGGHVEDDHTIQDAALREAREESGIADIKLVHSAIFDIDVHQIPARKEIPEHYHYDLRFLLVANSLEFRCSSESKELRWVELSEVKDLSSEISLMRMVEKTKHLQNTGL